MRVAVVEDDHDVASLIRLQLDFAGGITDVVVLDSPTAVRYTSEWNEIDALIVDWMMPEYDGGDVIDHVRSLIPDMKILVYTSAPEAPRGVHPFPDDVPVIIKTDLDGLKRWIDELAG